MNYQLFAKVTHDAEEICMCSVQEAGKSAEKRSRLMFMVFVRGISCLVEASKGSVVPAHVRADVCASSFYGMHLLKTYPYPYSPCHSGLHVRARVHKNS